MQGAQEPVAILENNDCVLMLQLGHSRSAWSSHQHCWQATDRQGTVTFSEVHTTAAPDRMPNLAQRHLEPQLSPFSLTVFVQVVERHTVPFPAWPLHAPVS